MLDVLVVGAGPTGLSLACDLARRGVTVRIIDRSATFPTSSRGKGLTPRTLEVLEDLGVVTDVLEAGHTHVPFRKYQGARVIAEVDPWAGCQPTPDAPYDSGVLIAQWRVEAILRGRLAALGVQVEWGAELRSFRDQENGVEAVIVSGGEACRVEAAYLIGCDGGKSSVRRQLGVRFEGTTYDTQLLNLGDVEVDGLSRDAWHQWFTPQGAIMVCPLRGSAWQVQASPDPDDPEPSLEGFQRTFDRIAGVPGVRLHHATWLSSFRVNVRMVDRMRVGRVALPGAAAHVHPIAGALGMNTGIQDAYNLGWKLGLVVAGKANVRLLDTYDEERLPIAAQLLTVTTAAHAKVVDAIRRPGGGVDAGITADTSQLGLNYRERSLSRPSEGKLRSGDRAPDAPCLHPDTGAPIRLFEVFAEPRFTLLCFGQATAIDHPLVRSWRVVDPERHARNAYDVDGEALVLIRPDNHVALVSHDADAVRDYLAELSNP
jgi:2-polyprenyl-6-methoxyphenol hydroxylase-like FAD-dependent oxidoreductase